MTDQGVDREPTVVQFNSERLLQHLTPDSLAAQLVRAKMISPDPREGLKKALAARLDQVRQDLDQH
jgi:hypothetical protein